MKIYILYVLGGFPEKSDIAAFLIIIAIGSISQKVITQNLRSMEKSGLLTRKVYTEVPLKVEYILIDMGLSLKSVLDSMYV